jgi:hypothetical protein
VPGVLRCLHIPTHNIPNDLANVGTLNQPNHLTNGFAKRVSNDVANVEPNQLPHSVPHDRADGCAHLVSDTVVPTRGSGQPKLSRHGRCAGLHLTGSTCVPCSLRYLHIFPDASTYRRPHGRTHFLPDHIALNVTNGKPNSVANTVANFVSDIVAHNLTDSITNHESKRVPDHISHAVPDDVSIIIPFNVTDHIAHFGAHDEPHYFALNVADVGTIRVTHTVANNVAHSIANGLPNHVSDAHTNDVVADHKPYYVPHAFAHLATNDVSYLIAHAFTHNCTHGGAHHVANHITNHVQPNANTHHHEPYFGADRLPISVPDSVTNIESIGDAYRATNRRPHVVSDAAL